MPRPPTEPTAVATAVFEVPAEDVWSYRLDFSNLPEYNPDVSGVERVAAGAGVGDHCGPGARYTFLLEDRRRPGEPQPVELWMEDAIEPSLVSAGMRGGNEAYEEFEVRATDDGCEATLTLWVTMPAGLPDRVLEAAAAASFDQINKELILMKSVLEGRS
ncbi:MAG TPA: SRPBCC family protein [Acidimicrobiales bacterium]